MALGAPATGLAAGIGLYEIATPDVGLGSAGYAARAQDAATLYKNPAGMNQLSTPQFPVGLQLSYGALQFSPHGNTSARLGTDDGGNAVGAVALSTSLLALEVPSRQAAREL